MLYEHMSSNVYVQRERSMQTCIDLLTMHGQSYAGRYNTLPCLMRVMSCRVACKVFSSVGKSLAALPYTILQLECLVATRVTLPAA